MTRWRCGKPKERGSTAARCKGCGVLSGSWLQSRNYFIVLMTYLLLLFNDLNTPFTQYRMTVKSRLGKWAWGGFCLTYGTRQHLPDDRIEDTHTHTHTHTLKSSIRTVCISVEIWTGIFLKQSSRLNQRTVTSGCSEWCAAASCPSQVRRLYNTDCNGSFLQCHLWVVSAQAAHTVACLVQLHTQWCVLCSCTRSGVSCTAAHSGMSCAAAHAVVCLAQLHTQWCVLCSCTHSGVSCTAAHTVVCLVQLLVLCPQQLH